MPRDRRVRDPAEVVVEQLSPSDATGPRVVEDGVILEQVLAPVDRPHLPAVERRTRSSATGTKYPAPAEVPASNTSTCRAEDDPIRTHAHAVVARRARRLGAAHRHDAHRDLRRRSVRSRATTTGSPTWQPRPARPGLRARPAARRHARQATTSRRRSPSSASSHSARAQANPPAIARATDAVRRRAASRPSRLDDRACRDRLRPTSGTPATS